MDELNEQLLSRHLDRDLPDEEERRLERRLAEEPALEAELKALAQLRSDLRELARRDAPPAELDTALGPLRRGAAPAPRLGAVSRWLAVAATLALGITVTYQVARNGPGPSRRAADLETTAPTTRAVREADAPSPAKPDTAAAATKVKQEGADERRRDLAPVLVPSEEQAAAPPAAPEAFSDQDREQEKKEKGARDELVPQALPEDRNGAGRGDALRDAAPPAAPAAAPGAGADGAPSSAAPGGLGLAAAGRSEGKLQAHDVASAQSTAAPTATLVVYGEAGPVEVRFSLPGGARSAELEVIVGVAHGRVASVAPRDGARPLPEELSSTLIGLEVPGLGDGTYPGEVVGLALPASPPP
jgi:hypothetical protein